LTTHPGQDVSSAWGPTAIVARSPGDGNHPGQGVAPAWAPDGRSIAFLRRSPEWNGYFRISALGGSERFIAGGKARSRGFTWAHDGKALIVAEELLPDEPAAIYSIAVETGERKKLITAPQGKYYAVPTVSPDGKSILFLQSNLQAIDGGGIYVMGIDGGEPRLVVAVNGLERGHTWSADGSEIIFATSQSQAGPDGDLWRVPVSGGAPEPIGVGMNAASPVVARQGGRLAYLQRFIERTIYRMPVPSPGVPNSPPAKFIYSTHREYAPQYSPDGKRIAFHSDRTGNHEIWLCDSEGLNPAQLTFFGKGTAGTPRWSPDGRKIVFDLRSEGEADIYVISADGGAPRRLTNEPSEDMVPSWSHDGRWIYFCSDRSGRQQIWKMSPDGGPPIQLTRQGGFDGFESADGKFLYYAKGRNMPSIWKVPVDGGDETPVVETDKPAQWRNWALSDQGIFFLNSDQPEKTVVEFFSFTTRQVKKLATLDRPTFLTGIALSPDGRWLLFTLTDRQGSNIMLVENFR